MKKEKIVTCIENANGTYELCRVYFEYDKNYWYYYILDFNAKLFLGAVEDDFQLNGFQIRRMDDIKKVETRNDVCTMINREREILKNVKKPGINLGSWQTVFEGLQRLDGIVILENQYKDLFCAGKILEVQKKSMLFQEFDADGNWLEPQKMDFSELTSVTFQDRYSVTWQRYFNAQKNKKK